MISSKKILIFFIVIAGLIVFNFPFFSIKVEKTEAAVSKTGLVGYWNMDNESLSGTIVYDKSGTGNNGTLGDGSTASTSPTTGKTGVLKQAFSFDGGDYVNAGKGLTLQLSNALTIEAWAKLNTTSGTYAGIAGDFHLEGSAYSGYGIGVNGSTGWTFLTGDGTNFDWLTGTLVDTNWHHIVGTVSADNKKIYIDGVLINQATKSVGLSPDNLKIGVFYSNTNAFPFNGLIDEVRIYNRALSPTEVLNSYNTSKRNYVAVTPKTGLVGYWNMDNNDLSGTIVYDKSGTGNNGTLGDGSTASTSPTTGKTGILKQAFSFDGGDYVNCGNRSSLDISTTFTVSYWVKSNDVSAILVAIGKYDSWYFTTWQSKLLYREHKTTWTTNMEGVATLSTGTWYHLAIVKNGTTATLYLNGVQDNQITNAEAALDINANNLQIGRFNTSFYYNGLIDEVRIYNRALSPAEVLNSYNASKRYYVAVTPKTGLVGYWNMDNESLSGTKLYDKSGAGNNGTLGDGGITATSSPTTGLTGSILKQVLGFDGVDDYVPLPLIHPDNLTYSAWIKTAQSGTGTIYCTNYGNASICWHGGLKVTSGKAIMNIGYPSSTYQSVTGTITVNNNKWHYIVMTSNSTGSFLYVDGVLDVSSSYYVGQVPGSAEENTSIGAKKTFNFVGGFWYYENYFNGLIDEVRVYNRALSAAEVLNSYNASKRNYIR